MKVRPLAAERSLPRRRDIGLAALLAVGAAGAVTWALPLPARAQAAGSVLPPQTLPVLRGVVAGQAIVQAPAATATGQRLVIDQQSSRAVIDWKSFNIGSGSEVRFNQPDATAAALNRIYSADPSIIQGKLSANGQVLLINQNGILFDRGTQIDVGALVASTLNLSNDSFLNRGLTAGGTSIPAFQGGYAVDGNGDTDTSVVVRGAIRIGTGGPAGAAEPSVKAAAAGSILLFAPVIENRSGVIQSPDGQVILAAGSKVYLTDANPDLQALRGLVVEVSADAGPVDLSSLVRNLGTVSADRGNVTLAGLAVNQEGRVSASTAVLYNGSVYLKAGSVKPGSTPGSLVTDRAGQVTIAAGAVVETPLDLADRTTMSESQSYSSVNPVDDRRGVIQVSGSQLLVAGQLNAPGGRIELVARDPESPESARLTLAAGSRVSAAGSWADVSFESNLLSFKVTSNELKDSPLQRDGVLRGQTVTVDLRKGSSLLDLSGYQASRQRSVAEKASSGGDVTLTSTGSLVQRPGAVVDVSGGGYRYGAGVAATTQLLGEDGKIYDIGSAPKDLPYVSLLDSFTKSYARWGQTRTWSGLNLTTPLRESGYVEGKPGGNLVLSAGAGMVLDGQLLGGATTGPLQLAAAPRGATLRLGADDGASGMPLAAVRFSALASDTLGPGFNSDTPLPAAARATLTLGADTMQAAAPAGGLPESDSGHFARIEVSAGAGLVLPADVSLDLGIGNSLVLRGTQVELAGSLRAPAGSLQIEARRPLGGASDGAALSLTLTPGARLDVAGLWLNNAGPAGAVVGPTLPSAVAGSTGNAPTTNGGSISLIAPRLNLLPGSVLDVSGGGTVARNGRVTGGNAGGIVLSADPGPGAAADSRFDSDFRAFALGNGGSLSLTLGSLQLGLRATNAAAYVFPTESFDESGFQRFTLTGSRGLTVAAATTIAPQVLSWTVDADDAAALPSGASLASVARRGLLPADQPRPVSLALRTTDRQSPDAVLRVEAGARVAAGVGGSLSLTATAGLSVDGMLQAPAGSIALTLDAPASRADALLRLGAGADLRADAAFVPRFNDPGLRLGTLSSAGSVSLSAVNGAVLTERGSRISVDGTAQWLDLSPTPGAPTQPRLQSTNAGTVTVRAQDGAQLLGTLSGRAPTASDAGGSFALELTRRRDREVLPENAALERRIVVTQGPSQLAPDAGTLNAALDINTLASGGFDKLRLQGQDGVTLRGTTALDFTRGLRLETPEVRVETAAAAPPVQLRGASVVLANPFGRTTADDAIGLGNGAPSAAVVTRAGSGQMVVDAGTVDLLGDVTINGVSRTEIQARDDIRLSGRRVGEANVAGGAALVGSLTSAGDIVLQAAQVYPTTLSQFSIAVAERAVDGALTPRDDGRLTVQSNGREGGSVYSAGGRLALSAGGIVQAGVLKAPLGEISVDATRTLELGLSSLTSVSAAGSTVPFGGTADGVSWLYSATNAAANLNALTAPPAKRIALSAPSLVQNSGATLDLSGGGALLATEFVPGSGGSKDLLVQPNTYAIIPAAQLAAMPVDPHIAALQDPSFGLLTAQPDRAVYDSVRIGAGSAVPAGEYALLPGRYALLPGAFLVQLRTGVEYANLAPGQAQTLANGQTLVAGVRTAAQTPVRESRTVGVVVRPGSDALKESDYNRLGSEFFAALAERDRRAVPRLPDDAGLLQLAAQTVLQLDGRALTSPGTATARLAEVDIGAERIAIVGTRGQAGVDPSFLQLEAASLNRLQGSVLIGGQRSDEDGATRVSATAQTLEVANSAAQPLLLPELMLAASGQITVRSGSMVNATGPAGSAVSPTTALLADAGGALLRLSGSGLAPVSRGDLSDGSRGSIAIETGARLQASGSMTLDATRDLRSAGTLQVTAGGGLALAAGQVALGDGASASGGLQLSNTQLAGFNTLSELQLKSYGSIELLGMASVGSAALQRLTLDTPLLQGRDGTASTTASLTAAEVVLKNSSAGGARAGGGAATLQINAGRIVSDAGDRAIAGFGALRLEAATEILARGDGELRIGGALSTQSPRIVGAAGARQVWRSAEENDSGGPAYQPVRLAATAGSAAAAVTAMGDGLGAQLSIEGATIDSGARIAMHGGSVSLAAMGGAAGAELRLRDGALIDVSGEQRSFNGALAVAGAGNVRLIAEQGALRVDSGAALRLDAAVDGSSGSAGSLTLRAQSAQLDGTLSARAASAQDSGRFSLDTHAAVDLPTLNRRLDTGGFFESREVRQRAGDLKLAAGETLRARRITLSADAGNLGIAGTLDASSAVGGARVDLTAQGDLLVGAGALIDASATGLAGAVPAAGGHVRLESREGRLGFDTQARIDLRSGPDGRAGSLSFVAARGDDNRGVAADLRGSVLTQRSAADTPASVVLQGRRVYQAGNGAAQADQASYAADAASFIAGSDAAALLGGLKGADGAPLTNSALQAAVELQSSGDLTLADAWDLTRGGWLAGGSGGTLTLRAAGTLTLLGSLGLPDDRLFDGRSWNLRLVGGADLGAASAMAVQSGTLAGPVMGDVRLAGDDAKVRNGTGAIEIAAARDFRIESERAVVTTAGIAAAPNPIGTTSSPNPASGVDGPWARDGGDIRISAGRDAAGGSAQWITDWLRRPRGTVAQARQSGWWAYRPNFRQNIATFGGGDIEISAGRDVDRLSAMSVSSGRVSGAGNALALDVQGGGDLRVSARGDVIGGSYLVSRGAGRLQAGGSVGAFEPTQLYLMGESGDEATRRASLGVQALGGIALQSVDNPTALGLVVSRAAPGAGAVQNFATQGNSSAGFYTYAPQASVTLGALSGDITLGARPATQPGTLAGRDDTIISNSVGAGTAYAPRLDAVAFAGSIRGGAGEGGVGSSPLLKIFPSAAGVLRLLAGQDILGLNLNVSDREPASVAAWNRVQDGLPEAGRETITDPRIVSRSPAAGFVFDVQARSGDIRDSELTLPARARVRAGRDIVGGGVDLQNLGADDVSVLQADAGDIRPAGLGVQIGGPGRLLVQAGRNLTLQTTVNAAGNAANPSLPSARSARLTLIAGVNGDLDLSKLDATYAELIAAGKAQDAARASAALAAFFGAARLSAGDIDSFLSSIQTGGGSDIDLLAPRGDITVGLTTPRTGFTVGSVTNAGGAIRSFLEGNFNINQGKVVTAQGGDILIYTEKGNIDAGRGAKTSVTTPAPRREPIVVDGVITGYRFVLPSGVAGSGIQTVTSDPDGPGPRAAPPAGDVFLFAPSGFVDAGEAGIVSGANIFIAAQVVLNAANISAAGSSTGVPLAPAGSLASSLAAGGSSPAAANKVADDAASAAAAAARAAAAVDGGGKPAILTVEVLGFGEKNCKETQKDCFAK